MDAYAASWSNAHRPRVYEVVLTIYPAPAVVVVIALDTLRERALVHTEEFGRLWVYWSMIRQYRECSAHRSRHYRERKAGSETAIPMAERTHCPAGHPYSPDNTYVARGSRHCRECGRARRRAYKQRIRQRRRASARGSAHPVPAGRE